MKPVKYDVPYCKQLANDGWLRIAHHGHMQTIYQQDYLPDHSVNWRGYVWTRQTAYSRSKEELGMALNPQEMY